MLHKTQIAVCSEINTAYINKMWEEFKIFRRIHILPENDY